jgi:hypothetical protein
VLFLRVLGRFAHAFLGRRDINRLGILNMKRALDALGDIRSRLVDLRATRLLFGVPVAVDVSNSTVQECLDSKLQNWA